MHVYLVKDCFTYLTNKKGVTFNNKSMKSLFLTEYLKIHISCFHIIVEQKDKNKSFTLIYLKY